MTHADACGYLVRAPIIRHDGVMDDRERFRLRDDALPVWGAHDTLHLGVDTPLTTFERPSPAIQQLLEHLREGTCLLDLQRSSRQLGMEDREFTAFWTDVSPAIERIRSPVKESGRVLVADPYADRSVLAGILRALGCVAVTTAPGPPVAAGDPVISVERFCHDTHAQQLWLAGGADVLPIRFSDAVVHIGPWLSEEGPCGNCLNELLASTSPHWRAVASQLIGRRAPTETREVYGIAGGFVLQALRQRLSRARAEATQVAVHIDPAGSISVTTSVRNFQHPDCYHSASLQAS